MARLHLPFLLAALCCAAAPAAAVAQAPQLTVDNLGQATLPISGAAAVTVGAGNACADPLVLSAPCAGWAPLGPRPWAPELPAAGGDGVELRFSAPVSAVRASATTNFTPGLTTPDGTPVGNDQLLPATAATATAGDATRWTITLPNLTPRDNGGTFTIVATDGDGPHGYALSLRTPRWLDEAARCGPTAYSPALQQYSCLSAGPIKGAPPEPLAPGGPADRAADSGGGEAVRGAGRPAAPRVARAWISGGTLRLRVTVAAAGTLRLQLTLPGRRGTRVATLHPRAKGAVTARFALPRALRNGRGAYTLRLRLTTAAGTSQRTERFSVR